jgi:DNA-binding GntR family transcriptional regulator
VRHSQHLAEVTVAQPPPEIASTLGLLAEEPAIVRRRIMYVDDVPVELADSYYPPRIAAGTALAEHRKIRGGAVTLLAEMGHAPVDITEDITVDTHDGRPTLVLTRTSRDHTGQVVEVSVMRMLAGQHLTYRTQAA